MQHRHPDSVQRVSSFQQDAMRRDFTINALGIDKNGMIYDYVDGIQDLKNKLLRAVGDAKNRFTEDALRIYRVLRFASKLGFTVEPKTLEAAKELVDITDTLAAERVTGEMYKVAASGSALSRYIQHLDSVGLLKKSLPEIKQLQGKEQHVKHHPEGDVYQHTLAALNVSPSNDPIVNISILLHDIGKGITYMNRGTPDTPKHTYYGHDVAGLSIIDRIADRFKLSSKDKDIITFVAQRHMLLHHPEDLSRQKIVQIVNSPYWDILKIASYADKASRGEGFDEQRYNTDIAYMEKIAKETSAGGGPEGLKKRLKSMVDGNRLIAWIPELNQADNRPLIGQLIHKLQEWIINSNRFDLKEDDVKRLALKFYNEMLT